MRKPSKDAKQRLPKNFKILVTSSIIEQIELSIALTCHKTRPCLGLRAYLFRSILGLLGEIKKLGKLMDFNWLSKIAFTSVVNWTSITVNKSHGKKLSFEFSRLNWQKLDFLLPFYLNFHAKNIKSYIQIDNFQNTVFALSFGVTLCKTIFLFSVTWHFPSCAPPLSHAFCT